MPIAGRLEKVFAIDLDKGAYIGENLGAIPRRCCSNTIDFFKPCKATFIMEYSQYLHATPTEARRLNGFAINT